MFLCAVGGFCPSERIEYNSYGTHFWEETGGNNTGRAPCAFGRVQDGQPGGFALRYCQTGGVWGEVDFSQCRDSKLF